MVRSRANSSTLAARMKGLVARSSPIVVGSVTSLRRRAASNSPQPLRQRGIVRLDGHGETGVGQRIFVAAIDERVLGKLGEPLQVGMHLLGRALEQPAAAHGEQGVADKDRLRAFEDKGDVAGGMGRDFPHLGRELPRPRSGRPRPGLDRSDRLGGPRLDPMTGAPVASWIAWLPPVWSGCQWVLSTCVSRQPRASAASRTGGPTDGSTAAVSPLASSRSSQT